MNPHSGNSPFAGKNFDSLSVTFDIYMHALPPGFPDDEAISLLKEAQREIAVHMSDRKLYDEATEWFKKEFGYDPARPSPRLLEENASKPAPSQILREQRTSQELLTAHMAEAVVAEADPRKKEGYLELIRTESERKRSSFQMERETRMHDARGEWRWSGEKGAWREVRMPGFSDATIKGAQKIAEEQIALKKDIEEFWAARGLKKGAIKTHPRYQELFDKWAWRLFLRRPPQGLDPRAYQSVISPEGFLIDISEKTSEHNLRTIMRGDTSEIERHIAEDLLILEGFVASS